VLDLMNTVEVVRFNIFVEGLKKTRENPVRLRIESRANEPQSLLRGG
jgi:hypothetical protein